MLEYVPVRFDLYRALPARLRWTLMNLVAFADRSGRCWPSCRKLAEVTGIGKSTVSRHLAELSRRGQISRHRKPGGCYVYTISAGFLPAGAKAAAVSHKRPSAVPPSRAEENPRKKTEARAYDWDERQSQWRARLDGWRRSGGRFWLPQWGPKPDEAGCFVPLGLLAALSHGQARQAPTV